jgi:DNA repair protein RecO (recombination protein O)
VRQRTEATAALLLRSVDYGEADRIVTLLTARFGKVGYIARAARRSKKRFGAALEPLTLLQAHVGAGRGPLASLERAEITRAFPRVLGDLGRMQAGFAALEFVRELTPEHEPDPGLFATVTAFLDALEAGAAPASSLVLCFQARLLALAGLSPRLDRCGLCGKPAPAESTALFDPQLGHLVCRACGGAAHRLAGAARIQLMRATGPDWIAVAAASGTDDAQFDAVRAAVRAFAEERIGRALRAADPLAAQERS